MSMDPRHPEQSIPRVKELLDQYHRVLSDIEKCTTSAHLATLEREGTLVVQEMYIVVPRLHEALMQASRVHRQAIARGQVAASNSEESDKSYEMVGETMASILKGLRERAEKPVEKAVEILDTIGDEKIGGEDAPVEKYVAPNQAETVIVEPNYKKKTTKKKTSK